MTTDCSQMTTKCSQRLSSSRSRRGHRLKPMGIIEPGHLVLILLIALFVFGPGRLGDLGGTRRPRLPDFPEPTEGQPPPRPQLSVRGDLTPFRVAPRGSGEVRSGP